MSCLGGTFGNDNDNDNEIDIFRHQQLSLTICIDIKLCNIIVVHNRKVIHVYLNIRSCIDDVCNISVVNIQCNCMMSRRLDPYHEKNGNNIMTPIK